MIASILQILILILLVPASPVDAMPKEPPAQEASKRQGTPLREHVLGILMDGAENSLGANISRVLEIEAGLKSKVIERLPEQCSDGRGRTFDVMYEKNPTTGNLEPTLLLLLSAKRRPGSAEGQWFKLRPDGTPIKAFRTMGKRDSEGNSIRGAGVTMVLEEEESERLLKRELDFWLKGIGLKEKPAAKTADDGPKKAGEPAQGKAKVSPAAIAP
jgi:hypothetical protein